MVEAGTGSLSAKVHPEKKPLSKKTRRCPIGKAKFSRYCMVEAGTGSLSAKVHPEKKTTIEKNSTVSDREFDSLSEIVGFFDLRIFSLGELL
jgi:hypothetical protein